MSWVFLTASTVPRMSPIAACTWGLLDLALVAFNAVAISSMRFSALCCPRSWLFNLLVADATDSALLPKVGTFFRRSVAGGQLAALVVLGLPGAWLSTPGVLRSLDDDLREPACSLPTAGIWGSESPDAALAGGPSLSDQIKVGLCERSNVDRDRLSNSNKLSLNDKLLASKHTTPIHSPKTSSSQDNPTSNVINNTLPASNYPINSSQTKSFAETTANSLTPKMNQAIVMNTLDGIKQIQYLIALSKITDATNIISASRISNNRFCVFLKNQQITNDIISKHSAIYIDNIEIPIRKLINPAKRIILSNVYPAIPDNYIIEALGALGVKITSPITALKAGFPLDQFAHIKSFRRQLYISHEDFSKLPGSIVIDLDNTSYRIFITDDIVTCFLCKKTGHVSSSCKTNYSPFPPIENMDISNEQTTNITPPQHIAEKTISTNVTPDLHLDISIQQTVEKTPDNSEIPIKNTTQSTEDNNYAVISDPQPHQATFKRPAPESTCPSSPSSPTLAPHTSELGVHVRPAKTTNSKNQTPKKKTKVRSRSNSSTRSVETLDVLLEPATDILQNTDSTLTLISFKYILENFSNKSINIHDLCNKVGSKTTEVLDMAEKVKPLMTNSKIKSKIQRLINLLFQSLPQSAESPQQTSN
ncbi:hypothetical protein QTP88_002152 [Uroleucon formosanum]